MTKVPSWTRSRSWRITRGTASSARTTTVTSDSPTAGGRDAAGAGAGGREAGESGPEPGGGEAGESETEDGGWKVLMTLTLGPTDTKGTGPSLESGCIPGIAPSARRGRLAA
ncbi:hypothetical protein NCCP2495_13030 [Dietzia sp. NCCP-2495]|nr:hypothetical protein NCCP2495_13030 [Dietzia sp. NCCP-2495]